MVILHYSLMTEQSEVLPFFFILFSCIFDSCATRCDFCIIINQSSLPYFMIGFILVHFFYQKENNENIFRRHVMTREGGEGRRLLRIPQCLSFLASSTVYESMFGLPSLV